MNTAFFLHLFLVLHIVGITLMAGTTVVEMVTFRAFRRSWKRVDPASTVLLEHLSRLGILLGIGGALLVLSGAGLLTLTRGVFFHQRWFVIKLGLVAMLILNGFAVGGRQFTRIKRLVQTVGSGARPDTALQGPFASVRIFYAIQLMIFLTIIGLTVANV